METVRSMEIGESMFNDRPTVRSILLAVVLTAFLSLPSVRVQAAPRPQVTDDDWPMLAHDLQRSGSAAIGVEPPYAVKWVRDFHSADNEISEIVFSHVQPIVVDGLVYIGTSRNNMYALDSDTGEVVWKYSAGQGNGEIMHSPAVDGGVLYFGSTDGTFYALDARTGALIWKYGIVPGGFRSSPAVSGTTVYIGGTDGFFYALGADDGILRWRYETDGPIMNSPAIDLQRGVVYFGSEDMHAYALGLDDGDLVWRSGKLHGVSMRHFYPVIADDIVIFRTNPGNAWRALECGDTLLGRTAGLTIAEDCTWLRQDSPGVDIHATPGPGDVEDEQNAIRDWLADPQNSGHRTFYALNAETGGEAFVDPVPVLWTQGAGEVGEPPVVTSDGRVLLRWRSYYGDIDNTNSAYLFNAIGELDQESGRVIPFNLAQENDYFSTGIFMISDEQGVFSVGGDRLYIYSHTDSVGSVSLSTRQAARVFSTRDIPLGVGHGSFFPGQRNIPFGPYDNDYRPRFSVFSGSLTQGVTVADGKLFWVAHGMIGAVEHGDGPPGAIIPPLDGNPTAIPEPSIPAIEPSDLEAYVLEGDEHLVDVTGVADLKAALAAQVGDLVSGERYAPFFQLTGKNEGKFFFADPSEELYVLSISLPYLSSELQEQVRTYLAETVAGYDLLRGRFSVEEGRRREYYTGFNTDMWRACQEHHSCVPQILPLEERLYYLWAYAHYTGDWSVVESNWQVIKNEVQSEIDPDDPTSLLASANGDSLNRRVASLIGYTRMAAYIGDQVAYQWGLDAATHGLAARIEFEETYRPGYGEWIGEGQGENSHAYFMATSWSQGGAISRYRDLVPEIGRALRDYAGEDVQLQDRFVETVAPAQYLSWSLATGRSEQFTNTPPQALEVYLAKALIMDRDGEALRQYIGVPWCRGDLYYIEKLALAIRASSVEPALTVTPRQASYGESLTYTVTLVGNGQPVTITDSIPGALDYVPGSVSVTPEMGTLSVDNDVQLRWTGTLTDGVPFHLVYQAAVAVTAPTAIRDTVLVDQAGEIDEWSTTIIANGYKIYLPVVTKR
jgi:uncharacterized repeat protein (TIGR01451 family)